MHKFHLLIPTNTKEMFSYLCPAHSPGLARMHQLQHNAGLLHIVHSHHTPGYPLGKSPHSDHPLVPACRATGW